MKGIRTQHSPIANFPYDILHIIFRMAVHSLIPDVGLNGLFVAMDCARRFPLNALSMARFCSQVSRAWRYIALNSALLWAPVLNTHHFRIPDAHDPDSTMWWKQVVQRARGAPLWVACKNVRGLDLLGPPDQARIRHYLLPLLQSHRDRIEHLDLSLSLEDGLETDARWGRLRDIGRTAQEVALLIYPFPRVFSGSDSKVDFDIRTLITTPLRSLEVLAISDKISALHLMEALKHLPRLRRLQLNPSEHPDPSIFPPYRPQDVIVLKHLQELDLRNMLSDAVRLLPRIRTSPGCKLVLYGFLLPDDPDEATPNKIEIQEFMEALGSYFQNALDHPTGHQCPSTGLNLHVEPGYLRLTMEVTLDENRWRDAPPQRKIRTIVMDVFFDVLPSWLFEAVMHAICASRAPALTELALHIKFQLDILASFPRFSEFLASLTALSTLTLGSNLLGSIVARAEAFRTPADGRVHIYRLFPELDALGVIIKPNDVFPDSTLILRALSWRRSMGKPIKDLLLEQGAFMDPLVSYFRGLTHLGLRSVGTIRRD